MKSGGRADGEAARWRVTSVEASEYAPPFAYTSGVGDLVACPEMIIFGMDAQDAYAILRVVVHDISEGRSYPTPGEYEGILQRGKLGFRPVHDSQHELYLGDAMEYVRLKGMAGSLEVVQLFWPDGKGSFPYHVECDPMVATLQPRLELPLAQADRDDFRTQLGDPD